ncbi:DUF2007 domain-containing protein [Hyphobacterium sp. HN65]|uniref:DUF2007 domain-containing protein n=1 Tax=Hyphobacterium lacteum TaxID=3116575 RepID=A0ABU7LN09_9PROT|nr:DUF2007 domain-containing protein [Hyphobacterium sp. HN65]MEE2525267.1 DUF2007 domain-containing protein [Hyphobacterium sp. HN65]
MSDNRNAPMLLQAKSAALIVAHAPDRRKPAVIEVFRTNDPIQLNFAETVLREAGLEPIILDGETANMYGGALPFIKRRIMVIDEEAHLAKSVLKEAFKDLPDE